jgi:hypothetical protein
MPATQFIGKFKMTMPSENEVDLVIRNSEEAIGSLVDTVVGQKVPRWHYDEDWLFRALGLTEDLDRKIREFVRARFLRCHSQMDPAQYVGR